MKLDSKTEPFWQEYLRSVSDSEEAAARFYEVFWIGNTSETADECAVLILRGEKTATSSLLWEYEDENKPLPEVGSLCVVVDGKGEPVCVVETTSLEIKAFDEVDQAFAYDYGEADRTLEGWRELFWPYYEKECRALGREPSQDMPLVCERFRVVYPR